MGTLETAIRAALAPEAEPVAPVPSEVAITSMPAVAIGSMPARLPWRHRCVRDANTGLLIEIVSEPIEDSL